MKRHKRDTGGFGKYIPHSTQGARAEFSELSTLPPPMPTPAHLSPEAKAQSSGLWRQRRRGLGWGRWALSHWLPVPFPRNQPTQIFDAQGLETGCIKCR